MNKDKFLTFLITNRFWQFFNRFYKYDVDRINLVVWVGDKQVVIILNNVASLIETTTHGGLQDFTKAHKTIEELIK